MITAPITLSRIVFIMICAAMIAVILLHSANAQDKQPPLPEPLENLVKEGAQVRYLGRQHNLDGWITVKNGKEQYFYVTPDQSAFVMGLLFDNNGKMVTIRQVKKLQEEGGADVLDFFAIEDEALQPPGGNDTAKIGSDIRSDFKTPAEQLFNDVESSNWVTLGNKQAPAIYTFVDPQCPYCKAFINDLRSNYLENGVVQVRMIPVGMNPDNIAQAAFLLAVPNPEKRWYQHIDGDKDALPISADINDQGVQRNLAVMQSWKLDVTPLTIYRSAKGEVKIVQGRPKDLKAMVKDLTE